MNYRGGAVLKNIIFYHS